jgi:hypothetical protein
MSCLNVLQTKRAIINDTLAERASVSPAVKYEVAQLYAVGALSVACVGLQCVGYDAQLSAALFAHAELVGNTIRRRPPNVQVPNQQLDTRASSMAMKPVSPYPPARSRGDARHHSM